MAATRRRRYPWVLAGLGALVSREARTQSSLDFRVLSYNESDGRTQVIDPQILLQHDFGGSGGRLSVLLGYDAISGASPTGGYPTLDATTSASGASSSFPSAQYSDSRQAATISYARRFGAHLPSVDLSVSHENDYLARGVGLSDAWTMAKGRGTLHLGVSVSRDVVTPVTTGISQSKASDGFAVGWTWIIGETDLFDLSASWTRLSGYLDDPYKIVPVGAVTLREHRPDRRNRTAIVFKYGHHFDVEGALKLTYRYYTDDWKIQSHALEAQYDQRAGGRFIVSPRLRLYTQTAADFYAASFAAPQTYMTSDYRLSPFDSVLGGLDVSFDIRPNLTLMAGASYTYQIGRDRVVPLPAAPPPLGLVLEDEDEGEDGTGTVSAADLRVVAWTAGITWKY